MVRGERVELRVRSRADVNSGANFVVGRSHLERFAVVVHGRSVVRLRFATFRNGGLSLLACLVFPTLAVLRHDRQRNGVVIQGRFVVNEVEGRQRDAVRLNVVGVTVEAVLVIRHDHLRPLLAENLRQSFRCFVDRGCPKGPRVVVLWPALHAGIPIVERYEAIDTKNADGFGQLTLAEFGDLVGIVSVLIRLDAADGVTVLTTRAGHENRTHSLILEDAEGAAGGTCFIVRVRVHREKSQSAHANPAKRSSPRTLIPFFSYAST